MGRRNKGGLRPVEVRNNVFNNMIVCHKVLPFEIKIPNDETLAAMSEAKQLNGDFISIDDFVK